MKSWINRWKAQFDYEAEDEASDHNHCLFHFIDIPCDHKYFDDSRRLSNGG